MSKLRTPRAEDGGRKAGRKVGWGERGKWREGDRPKAESGRLKAEVSRELGVKEQRGRGERKKRCRADVREAKGKLQLG